MTGFIKYSIVGAFGAAINFSSLWFLTEQAHLWYLLSAIIGIILASISNFVFNYLWAFKDKKSSINNKIVGYFKYLLSRVVTEGLYLVLLYVMVDFVGWHYMTSAVVIQILTAVMGYVIVSKWIWKGEVALTKLEILEANRQ